MVSINSLVNRIFLVNGHDYSINYFSRSKLLYDWDQSKILFSRFNSAIVLMGDRKQDNGRRGYPCVTTVVIVGLLSYICGVGNYFNCSNRCNSIVYKTIVSYSFYICS